MSLRGVLSGDLRETDVPEAGWVRQGVSAELLKSMPLAVRILLVEASPEIQNEEPLLEAVAAEIARTSGGILVLAEASPQDDSLRRARFAPFEAAFARRNEPVQVRLPVGAQSIYLGAVKIEDTSAVDCIRLARTNLMNSLVLLAGPEPDTASVCAEVLNVAAGAFDSARGWFGPTSALATFSSQGRGLLRFRYDHGTDRFRLTIAGGTSVLDGPRRLVPADWGRV